MRLGVTGLGVTMALLWTGAVYAVATTGFLPKYIDSSGNLGDSIIYETSGRIGIGTTSPLSGATLDIVGNGIALDGQHVLLLDGASLYLGDLASGDGSISSLSLRTSDEVRQIITSSGNVGIGTTSPSARLHVGGSGASMIVSRPGTGPDPTFSVFGGSSATTLGFRVQENGNVGIGVDTALSKLHVVGDVTVSGNIAAKYQDVAEWVPAREALTPGTVVTVDLNASNGVTASPAAYDTAVAGVISAQPGVVLGEPGTGKVLAAQSGRVRVRANTSNGAIRAGDLLVTSATPGEAMKSVPLTLDGVQLHRPGTILGKALEALDEDRGEILVLLTLQ